MPMPRRAKPHWDAVSMAHGVAMVFVVSKNHCLAIGPALR